MTSEESASARSGPPSASATFEFFDTAGKVELDREADGLGVSRARFAQTAGLAPASSRRASRANADKTQPRVREMPAVVGRVAVWPGGKPQAMAWRRAQPLPDFGQSLVRSGRAGALRDYLDSIALGGSA